MIKDTRGLITNLIGIILLIAAFFYIAFLIYSSITLVKNYCLINIAKNYCNEKGMIYSKVFHGWSLVEPGFICTIDLRQETKFLFLKEELKECKK